MITQRKTANAIKAKTSRACDSCLHKHAHWFCASDDAFLCQSCDTSVHSANLLASRHERVRLETSSLKADEHRAPAWHQGFKRKARTPRNNGKLKMGKSAKDDEKIENPLRIVPEIGNAETSPEENEARVPNFDPFDTADDIAMQHELDALLNDDEAADEFLGSEIELAEFAVDVESLLSMEFDDDPFDNNIEEEKVKVENDDMDPGMDMGCESLNWDGFDYTFSMNYEEKYEQKVKKRMLLRLDYEAVINAWDNRQGSQWTNGAPPPAFNPHGCCPNIMGIYTKEYHHQGQEHFRANEVGREARVSRYREKRRKRLFSKRIRYEVRKLNAQKRPRIKGRFVKRTSIVGLNFSYLMEN